MEKLKLEHLAPYLPYGLKVYSKVTKSVYEIIGLSKDELMIADRSSFNGWYAISNFKPILRPLSDLAKGIVHNGKRFTPSHLLGLNSFEYIIEKGQCTTVSYEYMVKLFEWHFDVFGLIEKGLAIDINTL